MQKDKSFINKPSGYKKNMHLLSIDKLYSLFEAKHNPDFYFGGECHSFWEMVYVMEDTAGITADDKIYTLSAGDVIFHKPMEFHKIWSADGTSPRFLICSFDLDGSLAHRLRNGIFHLTDEIKPFMDHLIDYLHNEFGFPPEGETDYYNLIDKNEVALQIILSQLELILLYISSSDKHTQKPETNEKVRLYAEIAGILEEHIYDKITISQIAKLCGVSSATVKNCFAEYAGCGVHKYFLNIKIRTAIEMLKSGMTVSEVSDMLSFANPNYFSYVFKRETGTCASSYRK